MVGRGRLWSDRGVNQRNTPSVNPGQQMDGERQTFEREKPRLRLRGGHKVAGLERGKQTERAFLALYSMSLAWAPMDTLPTRLITHTHKPKYVHVHTHTKAFLVWPQ